jgi:hypothetical protein
MPVDYEVRLREFHEMVRTPGNSPREVIDRKEDKGDFAIAQTLAAKNSSRPLRSLAPRFDSRNLSRRTHSRKISPIPRAFRGPLPGPYSRCARAKSRPSSTQKCHRDSPWLPGWGAPRGEQSNPAIRKITRFILTFQPIFRTILARSASLKNRMAPGQDGGCGYTGLTKTV